MSRADGFRGEEEQGRGGPESPRDVVKDGQVKKGKERDSRFDILGMSSSGSTGGALVALCPASARHASRHLSLYRYNDEIDV